MKDVTLFIAHADDEALFMWPMLDRVKRIVCASSDRDNPERQWCKRRGEALHEVGALLGCEIVLHHNDSEFYRAQTRNGALKNIASDLVAALRDAEIIMCHNPWGEYGNVDHILCHYIARTVERQTRCKLLTTDIAQEINWLPVRPWTPGNPMYPYHFDLDRPLFDRIKAIYDQWGCWTWAWEPQERCQVFSL